MVMGSCAASKLAGDGHDEDAVSLCRERKRLLKLAIDRRYAFADAHDRYIHSLNAVAAAIDLFVARHSTLVPFLITLPSSSPPKPPSPDRQLSSAFLRQTPSEPKTESFLPRSSSLSSSSSSSGGDGVVGGEMGCGYFFSGVPPPEMPPLEAVFGWDFFNPFDGVQATEVMVGGLCRSSEEEEDLRAVREKEGIPELEEVEEVVVVVVEDNIEKRNVVAPAVTTESEGNGEVVKMVAAVEEEKGGKEKGLTPAKERELLDALRDVEDQFIRAYDAGKDVSRMLEVSRVQLQSGLDEAELWVVSGGEGDGAA